MRFEEELDSYIAVAHIVGLQLLSERDASWPCELQMEVLVLRQEVGHRSYSVTQAFEDIVNQRRPFLGLLVKMKIVVVRGVDRNKSYCRKE